MEGGIGMNMVQEIADAIQKVGSKYEAKIKSLEMQVAQLQKEKELVIKNLIDKNYELLDRYFLIERKGK